MLVRASFVVVRVPVNVSGFRSILARAWHGRGATVRFRHGYMVGTGDPGCWNPCRGTLGKLAPGAQ